MPRSLLDWQLRWFRALDDLVDADRPWNGARLMSPRTGDGGYLLSASAETWNAATKSHNTYIVIMKRFVQPTAMLPGPEAKATIDPQNNDKPTHVSVAVHTSGFGTVCDVTLFAKPILTNVNTTGEMKMTTSPPMPCTKLARYLCGSGGKMPAAK